MKDRIFSFIDSKHLTPTEFADTIGMSRAAISSIKTGRTQPTLMLVEKIKEQFPEINVNWLIFGEGNMIHDNSRTEIPSEVSLFPEESTDREIEFPKETVEEAPINQRASEKEDFAAANNKNNSNKNYVDVMRKEAKIRGISKVILLYDDGTYEEVDR